MFELNFYLWVLRIVIVCVCTCVCVVEFYVVVDLGCVSGLTVLLVMCKLLCCYDVCAQLIGVSLLTCLLFAVIDWICVCRLGGLCG